MLKVPIYSLVDGWASRENCFQRTIIQIELGDDKTPNAIPETSTIYTYYTCQTWPAKFILYSSPDFFHILATKNSTVSCGFPLFLLPCSNPHPCYHTAFSTCEAPIKPWTNLPAPSSLMWLPGGPTHWWILKHSVHLITIQLLFNKCLTYSFRIMSRELHLVLII